MDGKWCFDIEKPHTGDHTGNINNIITVEKPERKKSFERKMKEKSTSHNNANNVMTPNVVVNRRRRSGKYDEYAQCLPLRNELNKDAPSVPSLYHKKFDVNNNSFQEFIGDPDYSNLKKHVNFNSENTSYFPLNAPPHIDLYFRFC